MKQKSSFGVKLVKTYYFFIDSLLRGCPILPIKNFVLRLHGAKIGSNVTIYPGVCFMGLGPKCFKNLVVKSDVSIGTNCLLDLSSKLVISDKVVLSPCVNIITHTNIGKGNILAKLYNSKSKGVVIENNVYIGTAATILDAVKIGEKSVIAAGSVITKDVSAKSLYAGVPAVFKKELKV